jgi:hypothetical protein
VWRRSPWHAAAVAAVVVSGLVATIVLRSDEGTRPRPGVDSAITRAPGPSLLGEETLRKVSARLIDDHGDARLVSLRLDARLLSAVVARDGSLRTLTLRSNGLDRSTRLEGEGAAVGPRVDALDPDTLPRVLAAVSRRAGRPASETQSLSLEPSGDSGRWSLTLTGGERWTAALDGTGVRSAAGGVVGSDGVVDVEALQRCFERARTPEAQADCVP